jgi:hypothetical protein
MENVRMPLFAHGERQTPVTGVPHRLLFSGWKARLAPLEMRAIDSTLDHLVSMRRGGEICTARLLPFEICPLGRLDWEGTPLMKIWDKVCDRDRARTCWCFALFLFEHMTQRPEAWQYKPFDLEGAPLAATRYDRCQVESDRHAKFAALDESMLGAATSVL